MNTDLIATTFSSREELNLNRAMAVLKAISGSYERIEVSPPLSLVAVPADAWRTLEGIRQLAEQTWSNRNAIEPSFEIRRKSPAIEIFKRLP